MPALRHPRKSPSEGGRLTFAEREEIACFRAAGHGVRAIARGLGRDPSTVSRELRRNRARGAYRASPPSNAPTRTPGPVVGPARRSWR